MIHSGMNTIECESLCGATLPMLVALIDKSLLRHTPAGRYEMHELLRQYAAAQLEADPHEAVAAYTTHCAYFATFVQLNRPTRRQ